MNDKNKIPLNSAEVASLWTAYMQDSMAICILKYFNKTVIDDNIRPHIEHALKLSQQHIPTITNLLHQENIPVPQGFTDDDVNINAPNLFSDCFKLYYIINMGKIGMNAYSLSLNHVARADVRGYFTQCISESVDLFNKVADTLLSMGILIKAPYVEVPKETSFISQEGFLSGFFGKPRMLLTTEIMHLFASIFTNVVGRSLMMGFSQTSKTREIKEFLMRGTDIANKHADLFSKLLADEKIPIPGSSDLGVTDTIMPVFSEKLMMFHTALLCQASIASYGIAAGTSMRSDLVADFTRLISEVAMYAKDGADIMIREGWFEQPPQAVDHRKLAMV